MDLFGSEARGTRSVHRWRCQERVSQSADMGPLSLRTRLLPDFLIQKSCQDYKAGSQCSDRVKACSPGRVKTLPTILFFLLLHYIIQQRARKEPNSSHLTSEYQYH